MTRQTKFFEQSYKDAVNDYIFSCNNYNSVNWDWIVLTAANKKQAETFRLQIDLRKKENKLPLHTKFEVLPDYNDQRCGSGGATLNVIRMISEAVGSKNMLKQKVLVIHSGGDSKRIPQYSACGKLFAPLPMVSSDGDISTIFDEMLVLASGIPNRIGSGMMIFPSDTEVLFNTLQLDLKSCDAAGLSMKAPVTEGQEHGVFLAGNVSSDGRNKNVSRFLHKQSEKTLRESGAVDNSDNVDIDTGMIWIGSKVVKALLSLFYINGNFSQIRFDEFVNPHVSLNFYSDFVYPMADNSNIDEFQREMPENGFSEELTECRNEIWNALKDFHLSLVRLTPAQYIHFGTTHELYDMYVHHIDEYQYLRWNKRIITNAVKGVVFNSRVNANNVNIPEECFIENCNIGDDVNISERTVLSNVDISHVSIPDDVVISGIRLISGQYVCRIYGIYDNPKSSGNGTFLGGSLHNLMLLTKADEKDLWGEMPASLWNASIFPSADTMNEAIEYALITCRLVKGNASKEEVDRWNKAEKKYSLNTSFKDADIHDQLVRQKELKREVKLQLFYQKINDGNDSIDIIHNLWDSCTIEEICWYKNCVASYAEQCEFPLNMRLYLAASDMTRIYNLDNSTSDSHVYEDKAYETIKKYINRAVKSRHKISNTDIGDISACKISLPVRVNFCGSPSDAAPYCLEHGGTMIDGTILLNGEKPIKVEINKNEEKGIRLTSKDLHASKFISDIDDLRHCGDPSDTFALHKASILATGLIDNIDSIERLISTTGGFEITTDVKVPKGSGLGTSSIIAAALIKAIHKSLGIKVEDDTIYSEVFMTEQLMNTGGGWQDQVGGLTPGIKYFTTRPGIYQDIEIDHLQLSADTMKELNERFALIFSGQRRLARNVLREEMNKTIRNDTYALSAIKKIQEICALMRYYLLKGNVTEFAKYITKQFDLIKRLDKGASNTCIEYIFDVCDDLIEGKSICGAGGGGFLQVVLKKGVTKNQLRDRIESEFRDCGVEVWDCQLI